MDFMHRLNERESCRSFSDRPVEREKLLQLIEAARLTPSACNSQPWRFLIADTPEARASVCESLVVEDGATGATWREEVPAFIVAVEQPAKITPSSVKHYHSSQHFAAGDITMAVLNMCYEAMDLGLGTCFLGLFDQDRLKADFGIPADQVCRVILAVDYPKKAAPPRTKVRRPAEEICCFNHWDARK